MKKVLLIGGAGYVGSMLAQEMLAQDYQVKILDTFWYGENQFDDLRSGKLELIKGDMRNIDLVRNSVQGVDTVIHLACISNDPSFDLNPQLGRSINLESFRPILNVVKNSNVDRFIYASSSSVYGIREEDKITEDLNLAPLTDYSKFKAQCEDILLNECGNNLTATIVRPATICGYSLRQRFDLVVNILTANAIMNKRIRVFGGSQYRPNLHIKDMVSAYIQLVDAPKDIIENEIFNIGSRNLTVTEIAEAIQAELGSQIPIENVSTNDLRSYRIDSTKIGARIGFKAKYSVSHAIRDLLKNFEKFDSPDVLKDSRYINILKMKELKLG